MPLSDKANYMRMMHGEMPEWVPRTRMMGTRRFGPRLMPERPPEILEFNDIFGTPFIVEPNSGPMPKNDKFILNDIRDWRDVIKRPAVLDEIDWEKISKDDMAEYDPEVDIINGGGSLGNGYFMNLMAWMGFSNGLVACMEEPDEVKALLNFLCDMNCELGKNSLQYYKPETTGIADDIAHERAMFVSEDVFVDIFKPMWARQLAPFKEAGIPASHHICGNIDYLPAHLIEIGVTAWNPAQPTQNDLPGIKAKFGRKLAICGGFEGNGPVCYPETTEEEVRAYVREVMDELAPGGGYAFGGGIVGPRESPFVAERMAWVNDEYEKNKHNYY